MERKFGPYSLIQQIAVGGMAEVHLARTEGIAGFEKYVAIKMIHPNLSEDQQFVQMLIDEAKITVQLTHVNIAQTFDLGRVGKTYYITMEFVEGCDLYKLLRTGAELDIDVPVDVAAFIVKESATGLDYAHRKRDVMGEPLKIVHRDVSPQNILISSVGEVKVIDFGIAKATMRAQETQAGVIKGKYYYMSPEQAWGEHVDARTDVFSAGIILYELLTGQMLYLEEDLHLLLDMIREANIAPPSTLRRDIPPELEAIVMKALQKRPNDRYRTAKELAVDLERFLHKTSPVFTTNDVNLWTMRVLGDSPSLSPEDHMPERDRKALTQGIGRKDLLDPGDDFNDENSIIFEINEDDVRRRIEEQENLERDINQETGVVSPNPDISIDQDYEDRDAGQATVGFEDAPSRAPSTADNAPLPELYPEDADERTVVSAPPGFGGAPSFLPSSTIGTMESRPPNMAPPPARVPAPRRPAPVRPKTAPPPRPKTAPPPRPVAPRQSAAKDTPFDPEQTLTHEGSSRKLAVPTEKARDQNDILDDISEENERTMAAGPWHRSSALAAANPEPAVSALRPPKKSRRTPPKGVKAQSPAAPSKSGSPSANSVLSSLISNTQSANVALSPNSHTDAANPVASQQGPITLRPQEPTSTQPGYPQQQGHPQSGQQGYPPGQQGHPPQQGQQQGYPGQQQGYPGQQQGYPGQQQGYPGQQQGYPGQQQGQQPYGQGAQYPQTGGPRQGGGFPQVPGLATNARLAAYNVDELPEAYRLTNAKSKVGWLLPLIGFLILATGAGVATYMLLTQDKAPSSQTATLTIVSSPRGAKVRINGSEQNQRTPTTFSAAEIGESYDVVVNLKGYMQWEKTTVVGTRDEKLVAILKRNVVNLRITSDPDGADVFLNGSRVAAGKTPLDLKGIGPETATSVEVRKDGFSQARRSIDWTELTEQTEAFELKPSQ